MGLALPASAGEKDFLFSFSLKVYKQNYILIS